VAQTKPFVIALEEHYADPAVQALAKAGGAPPLVSTMYARLGARLNDLGELRLKEMDAAGIDIQVISHAPSVIQQLEAASAIDLATATNNRLHQAVLTHPARFAGFAALPTPDPKAAADELERCVTKLGFKGAMIHGRTQGAYHDHPRFHPIFERAVALDVPIYIHPGQPHEAMAAAYYDDYLKDFPALANAAWGYTIDTASQILRTAMRFWVKVPVLSQQITVAEPRASTAGRCRTRALRRAILCVAIASASVTVGASPSGTLATMMPMANSMLAQNGMLRA